jgi:hypothetical protein
MNQDPALRNKRGNTLRSRRRLASAVLMGLALVSLTATASAKPSRANQIERAALNDMNTNKIPNVVWNGALVLRKGTELRSAPSGASDVKVDTVKPGEAVLLQRPRLYNQGRRLWAAVADNGKGAKSNQATSLSRTTWVNLSSKDTNSKPYVFADRNPDNPGNLEILHSFYVGVDKNDNLSTSGNDRGFPSNELASISTIPTGKLSFVLNQEGLLPSHVKPTLPSPRPAGQ